jgi:hypothetical protein
MIYFNPDPCAPSTKYYEIEIDDPELTKHGFSRFKLPTNGNATKMILDNTKDRSMITYVDFDKNSLDKSLKLLQDKLLYEGIVEGKAGKNIVEDLVAYFRNACQSRIDDKEPDFDFFKNGNVSKSRSRGKKVRRKPAIATKRKTRAESMKAIAQVKEQKGHEERIAAIAKNISSPEEWQVTLSRKYNQLYNMVQKLLPNSWHSLEFDLSIKNILHIKDCTLPFAGIVLGKPSSLKTVGIEMFRKSRHTFYTDKFSSKSFVSHSTGVPPEQLAEIDLLPKIKNKCFLTPELAPTFAAKDDDLIETLGILTRVLDGHGYESDSGAHGHRGYNERMMFTWIGAAVDIPFKVHKLLTTLGPKLYFLRVPKVEQKSDADYYQQLQGDDFDTKINQIQQALTDYQDYFEASPAMVQDDKFNSDIKKMPWLVGNGPEQCQKNAYMHIIKLGKLLAYLRGVVPTWHTQDTQGSDYAYGLPIIEEPDRAMQQLVNLAKGHALLTARNYVTADDLPLIIKVVLSTAPIERVTIFDILLGNNGILTVNQITESLNVSEPTARRTMTELKALGLVNMQKADAVCVDGIIRNSLIITLKEEFNWFLSDEFKTLRQDFVPAPTCTMVEGTEDQEEASSNHDNNNNNNLVENEAMKEKSPPYLPSNNSLDSDNDDENQIGVYGGKNSFTAYSCYHCDGFHTDSQSDYERHNVLNHPGKGAYPSKAEIEKRGLKPQGKEWET